MQPKAKRRRNDLTTTLRLPHELNREIKRIAKRSRRSLNSEMIRLLELGVSLEDGKLERFREFIAPTH